MELRRRCCFGGFPSLTQLLNTVQTESSLFCSYELEMCCRSRHDVSTHCNGLKGLFNAAEIDLFRSLKCFLIWF